MRARDPTTVKVGEDDVAAEQSGQTASTFSKVSAMEYLQ
jgi:hypothetical protein